MQPGSTQMTFTPPSSQQAVHLIWESGMSASRRNPSRPIAPIAPKDLTSNSPSANGMPPPRPTVSDAVERQIEPCGTETIEHEKPAADKNDCVRNPLKGESFALRIDCPATESAGVIYRAIKDAVQRAQKRCRFSITASCTASIEFFPEVTGEPQSLRPAAEKPWLIPDPGDPEAAHSWYTPARYFARQLIKDDSTRPTMRDLLATKVVQSLTDANIYKRGGVKPFNPATVKKAFVKVVF